MYILTIPSFTWIGPIEQSGSSIPSARAGHTCNLRDGQIILVGGFNTSVTTCDSPGIYVFNASSLKWESSFTALSKSDDEDPDNTILSNSYGYTVPDEVISVIGGDPSGSATVTTPAASATAGPFATGKPPVFTITASASASAATVTSTGQSDTDNGPSSGIDGRLIAAVVIACLAGLTAGYLGYCTWLYRRQVHAYKTHLAVTNRFPSRSASHGSFGRMLAFGRKPGSKGSQQGRQGRDGSGGVAGLMSEKWIPGHKRDESTASSHLGRESFAWVGRDNNNMLDPNAVASKPTPTSSGSRPSPFWESKGGSYGSGSGSGSGGGGGGSGTESGGRARRGSDSGGSMNSTDGLLEGQEPSFFSVVMGPRRALRVVNGLEDNDGHPTT